METDAVHLQLDTTHVNSTGESLKPRLLLPGPAVFTNSVFLIFQWSHMYTSAWFHILTCRHICTRHITMTRGKYLSEALKWKKKKKILQAFFFGRASYGCLSCVHVCINPLRMEIASVAIGLHLVAALEEHGELWLQTKNQLRKWREAQKEAHSCTDSWCSPEVHGWTTLWTRGAWTLTKTYKTVAESCGFDNTISSPPAAAKTNCSLLWMFGSNQSLPDTLSLQLLTFSNLPQAAACHHLLPQLPSPHTHRLPIPLRNAAFRQWSLHNFFTL